MKTVRQICLYDKTIIDGDKRLDLKRGEEYITTPPKDGELMLFSSYWVKVPAEWFGNAIDFTT